MTASLLLVFACGVTAGIGATLIVAAIVGDRLQPRIWWHRVVQHTACRLLGHKWTGKFSGRLCQRCVTFLPR